MTDIRYEDETDRTDVAGIGATGFYTVVGLVIGGFTLLVMANWMMVGLVISARSLASRSHSCSCP